MTTTEELLAMWSRAYTNEVKSRLRNDADWAQMLEPVLVERTRDALAHMLQSIDEQKERITAQGTATPKWLSNINSLRGSVQRRWDQMQGSVPAAVSARRETRAWKSYSVRLATALVAQDWDALDTIKTPYGNLTARQWLLTKDSE